MNHGNAADPPAKVHGHEAMDLLLEAGRPLTRAEFESALRERFGPGARFHTCSAEGMTAAELIAFLAARGKFVEAGGRITTGADRICSHGDGHRHD